MVIKVRACVWDLRLPGWNDRIEVHPDDYTDRLRALNGRDQIVICWTPDDTVFELVEVYE